MDGVLGVVVGAALLALLLSAAELTNPLSSGARRRGRGGTRGDAAWSLAYFACSPLIAFGATSAVRAVSAGSLGRGVADVLPGALQLVVAIAIADLVAYWVHRAMHAQPQLWRLHSVHHGAVDLHWWSTFRFHPVDAAVANIVPLVVLAALGFRPAVLSAYLGVVFVVTVFAHADVWVPGGADRFVAIPAFLTARTTNTGTRT